MRVRVPHLASALLLSALVATAGVAAAQGRGHDRSGGPPSPPSARGMGSVDGHGQSAPVGADGRGRHDRGQDHRELSDAVRRVERRTGGQVLSAERVPFDGRDVNRVKVIDSSGRVRVYMDDPQPRGEPRGARPSNDDPKRSRED